MLKNLPKEFFFIFCYLVVGAVSYQGLLNPYQLGLLDTTSVVCLLAGVTIFLSRLPQRLSLLSHLILLSIFLFITVSSWFYFDYFQSLYTLSILSMGSDLSAGTKALSFKPYGKTITATISICCLLTIFGYFSKPLSKKSSVIVAATLITAAALGILVVENSLSLYKSRDIPWLHPANLHPLHALFKSEDVNDHLSSQHKEAFDYFDKLNKENHPLTSSIEKSNSEQNHNLIIILLESFRADLSGSYADNKQENTPNFDRIAKNNIFASNYYSNTTHTISAELSIWCGLFDAMGEKKFSYQDDNNLNIDCLPSILRKDNFESYYFHGNSSKFYNRSNFIAKMGFDNHYFHKDQSKKYPSERKIGWGIDDISMFSIMMDKLKQRQNKTPFFAHITTLSNHYPFHWNLGLEQTTLPHPKPHKNNKLFEDYQNTIYYTDYALGKFWEEFKASPLYENTIVIVTSDHGVWHFDKNQHLTLLEKNERFYRAPLAIYHPNINKPQQINQLSSHIDLLPTMLDLLKVEPSKHKYWGKNIITKNPQNSSWAIMNKGVDHILRKDNHVCYFNIDQCEMNQQDCGGWRGDILFDAKSEELVQCQSIDGDLLSDYSLSKKEGLEHLFRKAKNAIQYQAAKSIESK